jgi:EamA domain-containing membrane protein RarD
MSQTILAVFVQLLTIGLPMIGVTLGTEQITSFAQVAILIATSLWIYVRRQQAGGVTPLGHRKVG